MRGEFIGVWSETWREIWLPLIDHEGVPEDIFCELYRALAPALRKQPSVEALADIIDSPVQSREALEKSGANDFAGERALVGFFESAHDELEELGGDELTNRYFNLLAAFIDKFSLRYDLRRPCALCPTLPGMFTSLVRELDSLSTTDQNIAKRLRDFKEAVQDLRLGQTEGRVANCVMKQVMLLEAVAAASGKLKSTDLAALCKAIDQWPHPAVRQSLLSLYGFASDFPGVRHGTPSDGMKRDIDMRDMVAMSILLTGFTPYLESRLSPEAIFGGSAHPTTSMAPVVPLTVAAVSASVPAARPTGLLSRLAFWRRE
ncbi:hypothetical protein [Piscinibacter sp.]|uniref:hypothetical protein n=1 Tax=Piscinibacter sp. TaxID=1903157 RepID=UPI002D0033E8|nr:hypothetical protein [Albitalea sp.]HUG23259.1 hypothetical protein [Albitalea sp.]